MTMIKAVEPQEWATFLNAFTHRNRGRHARFEVFGPKGGWDDSELEMAAQNNITIVTLGGRILRAETASIAITAILQHRFGDLN